MPEMILVFGKIEKTLGFRLSENKIVYLVFNIVYVNSAKESCKTKSGTTKRALDAGDSAASQAFSPLSSFFYAQSGFCQRPSASTDYCCCQDLR